MVDIIGTGISIVLLAAILLMAGFLALVFYGAYWTVKTWES